MQDIFEQIRRADGAQIETLLKAVLQRYAELYPDWEVSTISLSKSEDRTAQLDRTIAMLEKMKASP